MEPVTTAIIAALTAGAASGVTDLSKKAITDAYEGLKILLKKKFGSGSDLVAAVEKLEKKPNSDGQKQVLKEEVEAAKAGEDSEIVNAAQILLSQLKAQPGGEQHIQSAIGHHIAQADRGGTATVSHGTKE